jgi:hypothetical protein
MTSTAKGAIAWIETCLIRPDVLSLGIQQVLQRRIHLLRAGDVTGAKGRHSGTQASNEI